MAAGQEESVKNLFKKIKQDLTKIEDS